MTGLERAHPARAGLALMRYCPLARSVVRFGCFSLDGAFCVGDRAHSFSPMAAVAVTH